MTGMRIFCFGQIVEVGFSSSAFLRAIFFTFFFQFSYLFKAVSDGLFLVLASLSFMGQIELKFIPDVFAFFEHHLGLVEFLF
jgi:hypothetical protein